MGVHQLVLVLSQIILLLLPLKASAISCPRRCGNVSFWYPLGIGAGCYFEKGFEVTCDNSSGSEKPFLTSINLEMSEGFSYISSSVIGVNLPKISLNNIRTTRGIDLSGSPFSFSNVGNNFIFIGCYSNPSHNQTDSISAGCQSFCTCDPSQNATGCCDMICTLPPNGTLKNTESISEFYSKKVPRNCSSAFMVDQQWLQSHYLTEPLVLRGKEPIPASLEWGKYRGNCIEMYNSGNTSCDTDGHCLIKLSSGYICVCDDQKSDRHQGCSGNLFCDTKSGYNCTEECPHGYDKSDIYSQNSQETECSPLRSYKDIWIKKSRVRFFTIIGCCAGIGSFLLLIGIWWLYKFIKRRKAIKLKQKFFKRNGGLLLQQQLSSKEGNIEKTRLFTSKELVKATDSYNANRILGQGGQGTVYKGMLVDGRIVAIKKSKIVDESQVEEFINEVNRLLDILDARVLKEGEKEEIMTIANLTKRCLNLNGKKRPTMREVAIELAGNIRALNVALLEQQKYEEIDFVDSEIIGHYATGSSLSTELFSNHVTLDVHPLILDMH
ncbi:hypothetical protein Pint_21826 [Pistacia integerrima]|uniref:Uncharacterized protein n=1 Tax=Pistacia integerrima TaxID=434235 RepID=A0ACC0XA39_9ROSI|nr:hypothetical protein Pint_21826 [Pistacia integerrima]